MTDPSRLRRANDAVDRWFHDHVVLWWVVLAGIPGGAYAGSQILISDASSSHAVVLGAVFGAVLATITVGFQTWRA